LTLSRWATDLLVAASGEGRDELAQGAAERRLLRQTVTSFGKIVDGAGGT
jgi:hypothetical protein